MKNAHQGFKMLAANLQAADTKLTPQQLAARQAHRAQIKLTTAKEIGL